MSDQQLRERFNFNNHVFSFCESEMSIQVRVNKRTILAVLGLIVGIPVVALVMVGIFVSGSSPYVFIIAGVLILLGSLGTIEFRERVTISSQGVLVTGSIWPRPCDLSWSQIDKVETRIILMQPAVVFLVQRGDGKYKIRAATFAVPEVLHVVKHHFPDFKEQVDVLEQDSATAIRNTQATRKVGRLGIIVAMLLLFVAAFVVGYMESVLGYLNNANANNTTEFTATVQRFETNPRRVFTAEHAAPLVFLRAMDIDWEQIEQLGAGEVIVFRVLNSEVRYMDNVDGFISVAYLRVGGEAVISFDQYNVAARQERLRIWLIGGVVLATIAGIVIIIFVRVGRKRNAVIATLDEGPRTASDMLSPQL